MPPPGALDEGRSLVEFWTGGNDSIEPRSLPRFAGGNLYGLPAVLVEDGPWRFILRANHQEELYDVTRDPGERFNQASEHADIAEYSRRLLEETQLSVFLAAAPNQRKKLS